MRFNAHFFVILYVFISGVNSNSPERSLTASQWSLRFKCDAHQTNQSIDCKNGELNHCTREKDVCLRDPADWMWKYVDELEPEFRVLVKEKSTDERLANIIYTALTTRGFDVQLHKINPKNPADRMKFEKLLMGAQVNETLCEQHLGQMLELLDTLEAQLASKRQDQVNMDDMSELHIRLARVLDSFGRYESGFLSGRFQSFGAYDQCINTQLKLDQPELVGMRYCWAQLNLDHKLSPELRHRRRFAHEVGEAAISVGVCLPESCHSNSVGKYAKSIQRLLDSQFKFPSSIYVSENVNISSLDCVADSNSPLGVQTSGKVLLVLIALWMALIVYATYRVNSNTTTSDSNQQQTNWLTCISFTNCLSNFIELDKATTHQSKHQINLDALNPFKSVICVSFVMGHGVITQFFASNTLLRDHKLLELDPLVPTAVLGPMIVDSYFVLTGILITYLALIRQHKQDNGKQSYFEIFKTYVGDCLKLILHRYVRLFPLFYMAFAFKKSVLVYMGTGPVWMHGLNKSAHGQCQQESWLAPLMVTSYAYEHYARRCLPQTYTITCELLFVILIAPIVYLINKWPKSVISFCLISSMWSSLAGLSAFNQIDNNIRWNFGELRIHGILHLYSSSIGYIYGIPDYRLGSILSGTVAGYSIFKYEQQYVSPVEAGDDYRRAKWMVRPLTWLALLYVILISLMSNMVEVSRPLFGGHFLMIVGYYLFPSRLGWCMAIAILSFRLVTSCSGSIEWTKAKIWRIMAKLNYSIFLIHFDLLLMDWQVQTVEITLSKYRLLKTSVFCYVCSTILGVVVHLLIESPIIRLTKRYLIATGKQSQLSIKNSEARINMVKIDMPNRH